MTQPVMRVAEVAAAVAAMTVPGITILDLDEMKQAVTDRDCPLFGPSANDPSYLTDWDTVRISMQGNRANNYNLNYTYFHAAVGSDRGLFKQWPEMMENVRKLAEAIAALPRVDGCKSIALNEMPRFGLVNDASGNPFHGAVFQLYVMEF